MTLPAFSINFDKVFDNVTTDTLYTDTINPTTAGGDITFGGDVTAPALAKATVAQAGTINNGVTINSGAGTVTTQTATTGPQAADTFIVTNSTVLATSIVQAQIQAYSGAYGGAGLPTVNITAVGAGAFTVVIFNAHDTNALNGTFTINFIVS